MSRRKGKNKKRRTAASSGQAGKRIAAQTEKRPTEQALPRADDKTQKQPKPPKDQSRQESQSAAAAEAEAQQAAQETPNPKKKHGRRALCVVLIVLLILAVMVGLVVAYLNGKLSLIHYSDGSVDSVGTIDAQEDQDLDVSGLSETVASAEMAMPAGSPFFDSDVLNILLIGTDERTEAVNDAAAFTHLNELDGTAATTEFSENARADSLILVSLNIKEDTIRLASIERGTGVPILLNGYEGQYDWITHTFRYGGAKLTMDTVEDCFNVRVDHYVRVNFNSFVQIVNAVGGVDLTLTEEEAAAMNWEIPSNTMLIVGKVHAGRNHMDGYTALQYARLRSTDNDWTRVQRQRTVIQAVLNAVKNSSVPELDNLMNEVLPLIQTNFTKSEITALLVQLPGFMGVQAEQMTLPVAGTYGSRRGMDDRKMFDLDWCANIRALHDFFYGEDSDSDAYPNGSTNESAAAATDESAWEGLPTATPRPSATKKPTASPSKKNQATATAAKAEATTSRSGGGATQTEKPSAHGSASPSASATVQPKASPKQSAAAHATTTKPTAIKK